MAWKKIVGPHAITSRRRVVASAIMYGLSLTVRFTSPTGDEPEHPAQTAHDINPMLSILMKDGVPISRDWPIRPAHAILLQRNSSRGSANCRAACERPMPMSRVPDCSPP